MPGASEGHRLAAQAEEKLAPIVAGPINPAYKTALEKRLKTAITLYPLLKPIAEAHGRDPIELIAIQMVETRGKADPMATTSSAGATGPFQITDDTRKEFKPSREYGTIVERDADIAAQHLARAAKSGFTMPEALAMTYIAGIEGVKRWGGGDEGNVGTHSKEYGPMFREALMMARAELPKYEASLREQAEKKAAQSGDLAFKTMPVPKMSENFLEYMTGDAEAQFEAAQKRRNDARDLAYKHIGDLEYQRLAAEAPKKAGYK